MATWIEITTSDPHYTYYFGPFLTQNEAEEHKPAYLADLEAEGATGIEVKFLRCQRPEVLTVDHSRSELGGQAQK
ncbi:MAG: DUF1816 domain-containing protein [Synechococcaceae cyanobacterium SM2_3_1]|nr:DUF1816 domain-containing protein [Synechococcaceae cyanobacterium SM2_3_1]